MNRLNPGYLPQLTRLLEYQHVRGGDSETDYTAKRSTFDTAAFPKNDYEWQKSQAFVSIVSVALTMATAGQLREAIEIVQSINPTSQNPLSIQISEALVSVASALAAAGQDKEAGGIFSQALAIARKMENGWVKSASFIHIIAGLAAVERYGEAFAVAQEIPVESDRHRALTSIALALVNKGHDSEADDAFAQAVAAAGSILDISRKSIALSNVVTVLVSTGRYWEAVSVADSMPDDGWEDDTANALSEGTDLRPITRSYNEGIRKSEAYVIIASALARTGRYLDAIDIVHSIDDTVREVRKSDILTAIASALVKAKRYDEAIDITHYFHGEIIARNYFAVQRESKAFVEIASALAVAERYGEAITIAESIEDGREKFKALVAIAPALIVAGHDNEASVIIEKILDSLSITDDADAEEFATAFIAIASAFAKAGRETEADALFAGVIAFVQNYSSFSSDTRFSSDTSEDSDTRIDSGSGWSEWKKSRILVSTVFALATAGRYYEAADIAQTIEDTLSKSKALGNIVSALANAGRYYDAVDIAQTIEGRGPYKSDAFVKIVSALLSAGRYNEAIAVAESIEDGREKSKVLIATASALVEDGREDEAAIIFAQAFSIARKLAHSRNPSETVWETDTLSEISALMLPEKVEPIVADIINDLLIDREDRLWGIVNRLSEHGNAGAVKRLLVPCAFDMKAAYSACGGIALLYHDQAAKIAQLLSVMD